MVRNIPGNLDAGNNIGCAYLNDAHCDVAIINEQAITGSTVTGKTLESRSDQLFSTGNITSRDGKSIADFEVLWALFEGFEANFWTLKVNKNSYPTARILRGSANTFDNFFMFLSSAVRTINSGDIHAGINKSLDLFSRGCRGSNSAYNLCSTHVSILTCLGLFDRATFR